MCCSSLCFIIRIPMKKRREKNGGGAGTRTPDTGIMIPLLYQLSYTAPGKKLKIRGIRYCITVVLSREESKFEIRISKS